MTKTAPSPPNKGKVIAMPILKEWFKDAQAPSRVDLEALRERVIEALRMVYDPEIPVNIYDLGLIYTLDIQEDGVVNIAMTLTAPGCPVAQTFPATVEQAIRDVEGVSDASVQLVWDPPWTQERIPDEVKLQLGLF
jgi:FeS assembly SUF system protein